MVNINPVGVFGFGESEGQYTPITGNNIPVNTALQNLQLSGTQGFTGIIGLTGTLGIVGNTGVSVVGATGIIGDSGITGVQGITGLSGGTGIRGITGTVSNYTGLQGVTGIQGNTGIIGFTGFRGVTGIAGLVGDTGLTGQTGLNGITGSGILGVTGLQGDTGIGGVTGIQGITGFSFQGGTGIQGSTGPVGATGFQGILTLAGNVGFSSSKSYIITANTITTDGQQIEFYSSGITAEGGVTTTLTIEFGGVTILNQTRSGLTAERFSIEGLIIKQAGNNQEIGIKILYNEHRGFAARAATTLNMANNQTLTVGVSSNTASGGEAVYTLIVRRVGEPIN